MKELVYETQGTCAKAIRVLLNDDNVVEEVQFLGGCAGNTSGIASLIKGMKAEDVINRLQGIRCGYKPTSCPDQLAIALEQILAQENK